MAQNDADQERARTRARQHLEALGYTPPPEIGGKCNFLLRDPKGNLHEFRNVEIRNCTFSFEGDGTISIELAPQSDKDASFNSISHHASPAKAAKNTTKWVTKVTYKNPRAHEGESNLWTAETFTY